MRPIHRAYWLALCVLTLLPPPAFGVEPKAEVLGPTNVAVGAEFFVTFEGSVSDEPIDFDQAIIAGPAQVRFYNDAGGKPALALISLNRPGLYRFAVVATGKVGDPAKSKRSYAFLDVIAGDVSPAPIPVPPGPTPPPPTPDPAPEAYTGQLWGVLVVPENPTAAQAALRTSKTLRQAFADRGTLFHSYEVGANAAELGSPGWAKLLSDTPPPAVYWVKPDHSLARPGTKATDEAAILSDLKLIRGK